MLQEAYSSSEGEYEEEEEDEAFSQTYTCLFCPSSLASPSALFSHCAATHDLPHLHRSLSSLGYYGAVRLINFTRAHEISPSEFTGKLAQVGSIGEEYLRPSLQDDAVLMIDFGEGQEEGGNHGDGNHGNREVEMLRRKVEQLQGMYLELLESRTTTPPPRPDHYFESYANYSIHHEMLSDRARTEAYRDYIHGNPAIFNGQDVLDVGCGTGILSMFCARGGKARSVTAVDNSRIAQKARTIVEVNGLEKVVEVVEGKVENLDRGERKYDVLVSEWMGYGLLFECMLDSVIAARDKLLKPGGTMVPARASLYLSLVSDPPSLARRTQFWRDVYGFDMSVMEGEMAGEAVVESVDPDKVISTDCGFKHLDLGTVTVGDLEFTAPFQVEILRGGSPLTAVSLHFTCNFDGGELSLCLDTSPRAADTHWLQTVLYLPSPVPVEPGEVVRGSVGYRKSSSNKRGYVIELCGHVGGEEGHGAEFQQSYFLN